MARKRPPANLELESVVKAIRNGQSLTRASLEAHVSPRRVKKYISDQRIGEKAGGRWKIKTDSRFRTIPLFTDGGLREITLRGYTPARKVGEYMQAVRKFLDTNDERHLGAFVGKGVTDINRVKHVFETDPNTLYRLALSEGDDFSMIYRIH